MKNIINTAVETKGCVQSICAFNTYQMVKMTELKGKKEKKSCCFFWFPSEISSSFFFLNHIQVMSRKEGSNQINGKMVRDNVTVSYSICADCATSALLKSLISMQCWSCVTDLCHLDQPLTFRQQMEHFSKQREHFYTSA